MKHLLIALTISFLSLTLMPSCDSSVSDMLYDYNSHFSRDDSSGSQIQDGHEYEDDTVLYPDDEGFDPKTMLREVYSVQADSTLNLSGPAKNVREYTWTILDPENDYEEVKVYAISGLSSRALTIYIPISGLETDHTYQIKLEIVSQQKGRYYEDSCSLVIYPHYDF